MYSVIAHDGDVQYSVNDYVCDSVDDLLILPCCDTSRIKILEDYPTINNWQQYV